MFENLEPPDSHGRKTKSEAIRSICGCFDKRRLAAHELGENSARDGSEREPLMPMSEMHPEPLVPRGGTQDRQHVGHAGPRAEPGIRLDSRPEIDHLAGGRLGAAKLH